MVSMTFLWKIATIPVVAIETTILYYTVGTIYSKTSIEFEHSLWKNVVLAVEHHFVEGFEKEDIAAFVNKPLKKLIEHYRKTELVQRGHLYKYGEPFSHNSFWFVKSKLTETLGDKGEVLVFFHGGGYAVSLLDSHFIGILVLYNSLPKDVRAKLSIIVLDYSLTVDGFTYPTQIHEALSLYQSLHDEGYNNINLIGDSAGGNLALAVARYIAYMDRGAKHFSQFTHLLFDFKPLPQPKSLILISPWIDPINRHVDPPAEGVTLEGDLCSRKTTLGDWYTENVDYKDCEWINFNNTTFKDHWEKVDAISQKGKTLVIHGEREVLRGSIEKWIGIVNSSDNRVKFDLEKGGLHDCLFSIESIDYMGSYGNSRALRGDIRKKFCLNLARQHLVDIITPTKK